jgi:hypothetical protein
MLQLAGLLTEEEAAADDEDETSEYAASRSRIPSARGESAAAQNDRLEIVSNCKCSNAVRKALGQALTKKLFEPRDQSKLLKTFSSYLSKQERQSAY